MLSPIDYEAIDSGLEFAGRVSPERVATMRDSTARWGNRLLESQMGATHMNSLPEQHRKALGATESIAHSQTRFLALLGGRASV